MAPPNPLRCLVTFLTRILTTGTQSNPKGGAINVCMHTHAIAKRMLFEHIELPAKLPDPSFLINYLHTKRHASQWDVISISIEP